MLRNVGKGLGASVATFAVDSLFGDEIEKEVKSWFEDEDEETSGLSEKNQDNEKQKTAKRLGRSVAAGVGVAIASSLK